RYSSFPYTTLFRSEPQRGEKLGGARVPGIRNDEGAGPLVQRAERVRLLRLCAHRFFRVKLANSVERQHGARDLAGLHRAERVVDVVEASASGHHFVEQQPPLTIELEIQRDVEAEAVAAHAR